MKNSVILVLVCVTFVSSHAQTRSDASVPDTMKSYTVPGIVVTATKTEKRVEAVGRSISVISADQARASLAHSVGEVLSLQDGAYVVGAGQTFGMNQSLFLRGSGTNQTAVMVDGVRLSDPSGVNNALDLSELTFAGLDRIEIVRGSHSTLYGSSAVGGVVNLITKQSTMQGFHGDAGLRTGTFGTGTSQFSQDLSLQVNHSSGLYGYGEFLNANTRGLDATIDTVTSNTAFKHRDQDGQHLQDVVGKAGYHDELFDLSLMFKHHTEKKDIDKSAYADDDNATIDFKRALWTYGAAYHPTARWELKFSGGYSDMRREALDDSSVVSPSGATDHTYSDTKYFGTMLTNEFQATLRLTNSEVVLGAGLYRETMSVRSYFYSNSVFGPFEFSSNLDSLGLTAMTRHLFAQADLNGSLIADGLERFNLIVGARLSNQSSFGNNSTFELNPSYRMGDGGLVYVSYSTGFNAPSLYQLHSPEKDFSTGITRGNPALKPELSRSLELGWKYSFDNATRITLSAFTTLVEHSIEYVYLWEKSVSIDQLGRDFLRNDFRGDTYLNLGRQTTNGVEAAFQVRLSERLSLAGNVSLLSGTITSSPSDVIEEQTQRHHVQLYGNGEFLTKEIQTTELVRRPNTLNVSVTYQPLEDWTLRLDVKHAGNRPDVYYDFRRGPYGALGSHAVDAYTVVDLSQHLRLSNDCSVDLRVENLLNKKYLEIDGFTTRGRGLFLGVRYHLGSTW